MLMSELSFENMYINECMVEEKVRQLKTTNKKQASLIYNKPHEILLLTLHFKHQFKDEKSSWGRVAFWLSRANFSFH